MKTENIQNKIDNLSFNKLLSLSKISDNGSLYDNLCFIMKVNTDTDRDIFKYPIRINAYILVICSNGNIDLSCNLRHYTVSSGMLFAYRPGMIIQLNAIEPSELTVVIFRQEFLDSLQMQIRNVALNYLQIQASYSIWLTQKECMELQFLLSVAEKAIKADERNPFYKETVIALIKAAFYKILYIIKQNLKIEIVQKVPTKQEEIHFDKFMRLLSQHYREHHSIRYYASIIHLTPKYLSTLVKRSSGKSGTQWIDEYVILEAKNLIKYSNMSIQEVAYTLHFPNQSFFGKYFKKHTGVSPKIYRKQE